MVVVRKKGCTTGNFPAFSAETGANYTPATPFHVLKMGHVLPGHHHAIECITKSSSIVDIRRAGYRYYQVTDYESSCGLCGSHDGAIYPAKDNE